MYVLCVSGAVHTQGFVWIFIFIFYALYTNFHSFIHSFIQSFSTAGTVNNVCDFVPHDCRKSKLQSTQDALHFLVVAI